jgi:HSP20 family protein
MYNMLLNGIRGLTTKIYMVADDIGLIDIESIYSGKCWIKEAIPVAMGKVRKPPADVKETDDAIIVTLEIPGVKKEDIEITATDDELYVGARRSIEPEAEEGRIHMKERYYDQIQRVIKLPRDIKREEAKASMDNGLITVTLPKAVVTSRTKISVAPMD